MENSALHAEFEMTQSELQKAVRERDALEKEMETKDSQRGAVIVELGDKCTQMVGGYTSILTFYVKTAHISISVNLCTYICTF